MITIFNRKEILTTMDAQRFYEITGKLKDANIKYDYKIRNMMGSGQSRVGAIGLNHKFLYQYYLYVHKKDVEIAQYAINKR